MDCSPPGLSVYRILESSMLEWVAISSSRDFPDPDIKPGSPVLAGRFFTATWDPIFVSCILRKVFKLSALWLLHGYS